MELKVWVEGVVRVVCGLSLDTSCQDVVIALAQAIGQTGRYILILRLRGTERQLVADDCPLQLLSQMGQLAAEVQFILRRTGPSLSAGQHTPTRERRLLPQTTEPEPVKHKKPHKALTFNLGPSTHPKRTKPNRGWSPSPRASPELRASPISFLDPPSSKEEVFRQILQQQRRLHELEIQLQDLERETEVWQQKRASAAAPSPILVPAGELDELEQRLMQNEAELTHREHWEEQLQTETNREEDMQRRLHQIQASMDHHSYQTQELHARSARLKQDLKLTARTKSSQTGTQLPEETQRLLKQELHHRLQQGEELEALLSETQRELQAAEESLKDKWEITEELNKELRQRKLQQFILQTGGPHADQINTLPVTEVYLSNAGIME